MHNVAVATAGSNGSGRTVEEEATPSATATPQIIPVRAMPRPLQGPDRLADEDQAPTLRRRAFGDAHEVDSGRGVRAEIVAAIPHARMIAG